MNQKLQDLKVEVYKEILESPSKSDYQIAEDKGVSRSMVWNIRNKFIRTLDYELAQNVSGKFLADFQMATDYFKLQVDRLNKIKEELDKLESTQKTVFKTNADGGSYPEKIDLEVSDLLAIKREKLAVEKQQTDLWKNVIFLARQGEAVEVMRMIQSGRIQPNLN